jgi:uncharacterized protein DUF1353
MGRGDAPSGWTDAPKPPAFRTPLVVKRLGGRWGWALARELVYDSLIAGRITVPRGQVTDFESISRWLTPVYAFAHESCPEAATIHDYLYRRRPVLELPDGRKLWTTRELADDIFYEAMRVRGVSAPKAWAMWAAVRTFGWMAYPNG